ncbi:hypothetical protein N7520_010262 [Penicillium odoratum]|uniref:uncharacterized protein n=1 Tax=Penicillium odoratum TaxID=1167516 RepID=UPI002547DC81|nr:uncharacterized protein N7520_010262 [Penicillium odoratum]KAJ5745080.1 hypothetical protein N7520_010262 [Penicillium odoratum]
MMDSIILFSPIRPLWKIQASVTRRLGIIATITVAGIAVIVSCLRIIVLHQFAVHPDFTYVLGEMVIISAVELNSAIVASNLPTFKAVWRKHVTGTLASRTTSHNLSSLDKRGHLEGSVGLTVIYQRSERGSDQEFPDSSSTNNLVARPGSDKWVDCEMARKGDR